MRVPFHAWIGIVLSFGAGASLAQDSAEESDVAAASDVPERCITLNRVERTEVIDDRTLVFHMRGGGLYLNNLDRECPGLKREERFMYSPTGNRLCSIDTVTVLEQWAFGLTRGFTCSLGMFHPISEADLAELKRGAGDGEEEGDVEVEPVDPDELDEILERESPADDGQ
ncbi:MAG TPA: hypothetical protein VF339_03235 [Gammaproteobacteria bacterium]